MADKLEDIAWLAAWTISRPPELPLGAFSSDAIYERFGVSESLLSGSLAANSGAKFYGGSLAENSAKAALFELNNERMDASEIAPRCYNCGGRGRCVCGDATLAFEHGANDA